MLIEYRLRIRNAANSADALVVTSVPGGTNPYLAEGAPRGDGETIDPRTGETTFGSYSHEILDPTIGAMQRLVTSLLEDAGGRPQLGYRVAIQEFRIDGGSWATLINGLLITLQRTTNGTWRYTVGDPLHVQKVSRLFSPSSDTLLADFLTDWPRRGCVLGGPIIGATQADAFNLTDLGGWQMRVETTGIGTQYFLRPIHVYGPPNWKKVEDQLALEQVAGAINDAVGTQMQLQNVNGAPDPWDTIQDSQVNAFAWPGLIILIDGVPWKPLVFNYTNTVDSQGFAIVAGRLVGYGLHGDQGIKVQSDGTKTLTNGQLVRVRALTILPSEISPIYLSGHPVDLLTQLWDVVGIPYSASACAALTALIGSDASYALRITSARELASLASDICRPFGIGLRTNDDGELEPFDARLGRSIDDPVATITDDDVVDGSVFAYDLDTADAIRTVHFRGKAFRNQRNVPQHRGDTTIVDGVAVQEVDITFLDDDPDALPYGDFELSYEGMIVNAGAPSPAPSHGLEAIARRFFDRWGHGGLAAEMTLVRGGVGDAIQLGDEVFVNLTQTPNHNYLLGDNPAIAARAMQVVRRTVRAIGYDVKLVDSGASRQPPSTVPTLSIGASTDLPRTAAEATITNAATLNAAGDGARLQVAYTDDGSDAATSQFTDVLAWGPGKIPTGAIRLPPAIAGLTVQVRARTELPGARATNWSALQKVTLDGVDPVTGLTATPDTDGSKCLLEWTPGSATDLADIWLRLDGETFAAAVLVATLEPGSVQYELAGLVPGTDYIASVQHRDPRTQDLSAAVDVAFTAAATGAALTAPLDPAPFAGSPAFGHLRLVGLGLTAGRYGIAVVATEFPGEVEIAEAVETAPGAGTYGSFATVGRIESASGNWTLWQSIAPNDGLRRQLKARHVRDGATSSSYTAIVVATPWTYQQLPAYPGDALLELKVTPLTPTAPDRFAYRLTPRDTHPSGTADLTLDFDAESGLVNYEYNSTTPAAPVAVVSSSNNDYEAIRPLAGDGAKSVSWNVTKSGRRIGLSGSIVIPEMPPSGSGASDPEFVSVGLSSISAPCDGGGSATLNFTTANMPGGETYNVSWTVLTGTYAGTSGSDTGISSGYVINTALCPGETLRVTLTAIDGGVIAIDVEDFET